MVERFSTINNGFLPLLSQKFHHKLLQRPKYISAGICMEPAERHMANTPSQIYGWQPLKNLKGCGLLKTDCNLSNFLKAVFHKIYSVHLPTTTMELCLSPIQSTTFNKEENSSFANFIQNYFGFHCKTYFDLDFNILRGS